MPSYSVAPAHDCAHPFDRIRFSAPNLAAAQAHAQNVASVLLTSVVLEDGTAPALGVVRTRYAPAAGTITQAAGIVHGVV